MRMALVIIGLILAGQTWAADYKDDFNRGNTEWASEGGMIDAASEACTISRGKFRIQDGLLVTDPEVDQEKELILEHLPVSLQDGGKFEASVDFLIPEPSQDLAGGSSSTTNRKGRHQGLVAFASCVFVPRELRSISSTWSYPAPNPDEVKPSRETSRSAAANGIP